MEIVRQLRAQGYALSLEENGIRYKVAEGVNPDKAKVGSLLNEVRAHKAEIMSFLKSECLYKGREEKIHPELDMESVTVFSKVLGHNIRLSWRGNNPNILYVGRTPYTLKEVDRLNQGDLSARAIRAIHNIKKSFEGKISD